MADEETRSLLQEWGIDAACIQRFQEHGITKEIMKDLTDDLLKEIIPCVGPRITFMKKWKTHIAMKKRNENIEESDSESISTDENSDDASQYLRKVNKQKCFIDKRTYERALRPNVKEIITSTEQGRVIVRAYKNQPLSRQARNDIIEIVIDSIINNVKG
ncbi:hypothetical protein DMN91_001264 [Ooceraea biroi]|uniref:SAM domain-containing protein n=2 Tax=Ooceraea biroi TaxID=2015173 RepID=A0A3L8E3Z2_OOCBI|nr:hypothetical protein DMN91_001264 [Ooceraea biroi]